MCAAASPRAYAIRASSLGLGRFVFGGWLLSAFFHLCNGIRHLFWDAGYGFELKDAYAAAGSSSASRWSPRALSWIFGLRLI